MAFCAVITFMLIAAAHCEINHQLINGAVKNCRLPQVTEVEVKIERNKAYVKCVAQGKPTPSVRMSDSSGKSKESVDVSVFTPGIFGNTTENFVITKIAQADKFPTFECQAMNFFRSERNSVFRLNITSPEVYVQRSVPNDCYDVNYVLFLIFVTVFPSCCVCVLFTLLVIWPKIRERHGRSPSSQEVNELSMPSAVSSNNGAHSVTSIRHQTATTARGEHESLNEPVRGMSVYAIIYRCFQATALF